MSEIQETMAIKLKPSMSMDNVAEFYEQLKSSLETDAKKIIFECAFNEEIDFASLQTLAVYYRNRVAEGVKITWDNPSIALFERSVELGLDEAFGL